MITSIPWLQSALNFFINFDSLGLFPNIQTVPQFHSIYYLSLCCYSVLHCDLETWSQKGDTIQIPYCVPTNIRRHLTKLVGTGNWSPGFVHPWFWCRVPVDVFVMETRAFCEAGIIFKYRSNNKGAKCTGTKTISSGIIQKYHSRVKIIWFQSQSYWLVTTVRATCLAHYEYFHFCD